MPTPTSAAAEAARRAAEEAARRAREEAARRAAAEAAAKAAAEAAAKAAAAKAAKAKLVQANDELSTGQGSALRNEALRVSGASSLATEVRGDDSANCLERAANHAEAGDSVVLLEDEQDPVGHAVVQREDGTVSDPNEPDREYESLEAYQAQNPRYSNPAVVSDENVERILSTPPGAQRQQLIRELNLEAVASRQVADAGEIDPQVRASVDAVIAPGATAAQREDAYANVQAYVDEAGGVGAEGISVDELYGRTNEVLTEAGIPTAATPEVQQWADLVLAPTATAEQRQRAYTELQAQVTQAGGLSRVAEPGQIPERFAQLLGERNIPAFSTDVVSAIDHELMQGATLDARRAGYLSLTERVNNAGRSGESLTPDAIQSMAHEVVTGQSNETNAPAAADRIAQLADDGASAEEIRAALDEELARFPDDTGYQEALATELAKRMDAYNPINDDCDDIQARNEALGDAIVYATEKGGREMAQAFARGFASVADDDAYSRPAGVVMGDYFAQALEGPMAEQGAVRFGLALTEELVKTNDLQSAGRVEQVLQYAVYQVQERWNDLNGDVQDLHEDLGAALGPVGGAMTPEQQQLAVEEFQRRNQGKFDEWEAAGAQYAQVMAALGESDRSNWTPEMQGAAQSMAEDLPELSRTQAGMDFLAQEVEKQGAGQPSFMDHVVELGEQGKLGKELLEQISVGIARGVSMRAFSYAQAGQITEATNLLEGLRRNANIFGVEGHTMNGLVDHMRTLRPGMSPADLQQWATTYGQRVDDVVGTGLAAGPVQALRGLGAAFGVAYTLNGVATPGDIAAQTQMLADTIGLGADAGITVVEALNASGRLGARGGSFVNAAGKVFRITGAVTGGISAIVDGLSAARAFSEGKPLEGAASAQMAVGGLLMTAAAFQVIPGWGQLAGATLLFTGLVTSIFAGRAEENRVRDLRKDLMIAAGFDEGVADTFRNANEDRLRELIDEMKLSPEQVVELATNWPYVLTEGEGNGVSFQGLRELQQAAGLTNDEVMELFRACGTGEEADRCIAMLLGNTARAMGDRSTLQGWLDIANGYLESSTDDEHTRVWTIIRDELLEQQQGANGER